MVLVASWARTSRESQHTTTARGPKHCIDMPERKLAVLQLRQSFVWSVFFVRGGTIWQDGKRVQWFCRDSQLQEWIRVAQGHGGHECWSMRKLHVKTWKQAITTDLCEMTIAVWSRGCQHCGLQPTTSISLKDAADIHQQARAMHYWWRHWIWSIRLSKQNLNEQSHTLQMVSLIMSPGGILLIHSWISDRLSPVVKPVLLCCSIVVGNWTTWKL